MNPKLPIHRLSSLNQGDFILNLEIDESKRNVPPPIEVPDIKVNGESVESVTFHPHVNPLMFTFDFGIKGEKAD